VKGLLPQSESARVHGRMDEPWLASVVRRTCPERRESLGASRMAFASPELLTPCMRSTSACGWWGETTQGGAAANSRAARCPVFEALEAADLEVD